MSLELSGLLGSVPVGFMAAVGLLRIAPAGCRLSWHAATRCAQISGIDREPLLDHLVGHMRNRAASPELHLADDVRKMRPERYHEIVSSCAGSTLDWVRAFWWEEGEEIHPTALCLTGGPQRMIKMARELAERLDPERGRGGAGRVRDKFAEALFGPWQYADDVSSWGWDPSTFRPGATTSDAPTNMKLAGVAAAYWLAWESLPLFPNLPGQGTLNFDPQRNARGWAWCTWSEPLDVHAVRALVRRPAEAAALGGQRYRSGIAFAGQIQFFEPARQITGV